MTREELVKAIYDSCEDRTCPDNYDCERIEDGDPRVLCMQCAEKLLKEYEDKIKADAIDEFVDATIESLERTRPDNATHLAICTVEFMKQWLNNLAEAYKGAEE